MLVRGDPCARISSRRRKGLDRKVVKSLYWATPAQGFRQGRARRQLKKTQNYQSGLPEACARLSRKDVQGPAQGCARSCASRPAEEKNACARVRMHVHMHTCMYTHAYTPIRRRCMHTCMHAHACAHTCSHISVWGITCTYFQ